MLANAGGVGIGMISGPAEHRRSLWEGGLARCGRGLAALGAALALLLGSGPASALDIDTIPSTGLVIDQPGTYTFTRHLFHDTSRQAILITASNVVLDLNGYTLSGSRLVFGGSTIGIDLQAAHAVTVRNGTVSGFRFGIILESSSSNTIQHNTASNNWYGLLVNNSNSNTIQDNNLSSNSIRGMGVGTSHGNTIQHNTVNGNGQGIWLLGCSSSTIENNTADSNSQWGILLSDGCSNNLVQNNTTNGNDWGILVFYGSSSNTIENNTANSNGDGGIAVYQSSNNTLQNNTALNNNTGTGGFAHADLYDSNLPGACVNTWTGNTFVSDNETGADFGPAGGCIRTGVGDLTAPTWPNGVLSASHVGLTALTLNWPAATDAVGVTAYRLYRNGALLTTVTGTVGTYGVTTLTADTAYTFQVEACDAAGNCTSGPSLTVSTLTPQAASQEIIDPVNDLVEAGVLDQGQGNGSIALLEAALQQLDQGNKTAAIQQLQAFIRQVNRFINDGVLTAAQGQPLIDAAQEVIDYLGG